MKTTTRQIKKLEVNVLSKRFGKLESQVMKAFEDAAPTPEDVDYCEGEIAMVCLQLGAFREEAEAMIQNLMGPNKRAVEEALNRYYPRN